MEQVDYTGKHAGPGRLPWEIHRPSLITLETLWGQVDT